MKIYIFALSIILGSCSTTKQSAEITDNEISSGINRINLKVNKFVLDNGLRVLIYENHRLPIISYYTFFDVGGRHEEKGTTGATHFLEHMMFKGSEKFGPGIFDSEIERSGGMTNAYTSFDNTVYYQSLPSKMINRIIELEADRMNSVLLNNEALEKERNVIFEERKMRVENRPQGKLYYSLMQNIFEGTPYGGSVIGSVDDLKALSRDGLLNFYHNFYTPDNAVLVITGDVDSEEIIKKIKKHYGQLERSSKKIQEYKNKKNDPDLYSHRGKYKRHIKVHGSNPVPLFMIGYKGKALGEKQGFIMDFLSSILGQGESSYLYQKYVKGKRPILSDFGAANYTLKKNGIFWFNGQILSGKGINRFKKTLLKDLKNVCKVAITERTIAKTKNQYLIDYFSGIQTNEGVARFLGNNEIFYGDYEYYKKELEIYNSITVDDVKSACNDTFDNQEYIFVSIWNKHRKS